MQRISQVSIATLFTGAAFILSGQFALADNTPTPSNVSTGGASFPARVAGVVAGTFVGTPVCIVRKSIDEEKYGIQGIVGNTNSKMKKVAAGAFWLPFSVVTGFVESPVCAAVNSLRTNDKPFSKSQFAISDCPKDAAASSTTPTSTDNSTPSN